MNIILNQEELNLLIELITDRKNELLEDLELNINDVLDLDYLSEIFNLKSKLCNYSVLNQEEN